MVFLADSPGEIVRIEYVVLPVYLDLQAHRLRQNGHPPRGNELRRQFAGVLVLATL